MHTASPSTAEPIESIFHYRTLAGNPFSESPYLPINNYDESLAFRRAIETLPGADVCAQHNSLLRRHPSTAALDRYQSSSNRDAYAHPATAEQHRITKSPYHTHHEPDQD